YSRSTRNTRIERLWVEVGSHFARHWRAFFYRLEALHGLRRKDPKHRWLLHHLFLDSINVDCAQFQLEWNAHPISGEGNDESPNDKRLLGMLQHGVYRDDCDGLTPEEIDENYGIHGAQRARDEGETGAGGLDDEEIPLVDDDEELDSDNEEWDAADGIHLPPVAVPKTRCPFDTEDDLALFQQAFQAADAANLLPDGLGLIQEEWDDGMYPSFEIIESGRKGSKELRVDLPDIVWRPRAGRWGRALYIMQQIIQDT
ncbi:hypothetical protein C8J56DRAFT_788316, partial [Mycena floridula]